MERCLKNCLIGQRVPLKNSNVHKKFGSTYFGIACTLDAFVWHNLSVTKKSLFHLTTPQILFEQLNIVLSSCFTLLYKQFKRLFTP